MIVLYHNMALNLVILGWFGKGNLEDFDHSRTCQASDKMFQTQVTVVEHLLITTDTIVVITSILTNV